jgi:hypothetical protein
MDCIPFESNRHALPGAINVPHPPKWKPLLLNNFRDESNRSGVTDFEKYSAYELPASPFLGLGVETSAARFLLDRAQRFRFRRLMLVGHSHCVAQAAFAVAHDKGSTRIRESAGWEVTFAS